MYHFPKRSKHNKADESDASDSIWAAVIGFVKNFGCSFDYAIYEVSYANVALFGRAMPTFNSDRTKDGRKIIDATDPKYDSMIDSMLS